MIKATRSSGSRPQYRFYRCCEHKEGASASSALGGAGVQLLLMRIE